MISSMTGFGQACAKSTAWFTPSRSGRSTTGISRRSFACRISPRLWKAISKSCTATSIQRGTVSYSLRVKNISGRAMFDIDENTLKTYVGRLENLLPDRQHRLSDRSGVAAESAGDRSAGASRTRTP